MSENSETEQAYIMLTKPGPLIHEKLVLRGSAVNLSGERTSRPATVSDLVAIFREHPDLWQRVKDGVEVA